MTFVFENMSFCVIIILYYVHWDIVSKLYSSGPFPKRTSYSIL